MAFQEDLDTATLEEWRAGDQIGIKDGYEALFRKLVAYGSGKATIDVTTLVYTGTGNGLIHNIDLGVDSPTETWTLTLTSATAFTVSGSVSGAQLVGVVGAPYTTADVRGAATSGTITQITDSGATFITDLVAVGDRVVNVTQAEQVIVTEVVSETVLNCTTLASGSWNGDTYHVLKPNASLINFDIRAGGTAFINTDAWVMDVTEGDLASPSTDQWVLDRWDPFADFKAGATEKNGYVHWHGPGDGTEEIYCGIRLTETPASQIFDFVMRGFTGFSEGSDFDNQPGGSSEVYTAFWNFDIGYWFAFNSRRYVVSAVVSGTYHSLYSGFILAYASPEEYPYPLVIIGEDDTARAYNSTDANFRGIHKSNRNIQMRNLAGTWLDGLNSEIGTNNCQRWPNMSSQFSPLTFWSDNEDFDNFDKQLFPIVIIDGNSTPDINNRSTLGELQGCRVVTGFNNSSESVLAISGTDHIVFEDIFRQLREDFWALEMD